jgi:hypothetical protein
MIVGVPDHKDLNDTATGWMNLAWEFAITEAERFQETAFVYDEIESEHGPLKANQLIEEHWRAKRLILNNSISLLQQSLEIFIKAKIAEISPYLLIAGDPQSWPSLDNSGVVDFSDFKTIDATHLCRAAKIVSSSSLSDNFLQIYTRLRKERNKIMHLNAVRMKAEVGRIILDILSAHNSLFPDDTWVEFRRRHIEALGEYSDKEGIFDAEDYTNDKICHEVTAAISELKPSEVKLFFCYDKRKKALRCPRCLELRTSDDEWRFAQKQVGGHIKCMVCLSTYSKDEYERAVINYFGYLDKAELAEVANETKKDLS